MSCCAMLVCSDAVVIVGDGRDPSTCNYTAVIRAVGSGDGNVTFNCGPSVVTILVQQQIPLTTTLTIDGRNRVILDGAGNSRIFFIADSSFSTWSMVFTIKNIGLVNGGCHPQQNEVDLFSPVAMYDNGGCVSMGLGGTLNLEGVTFTNCSCIVEQNNQSGEVAFSGGALYLEDYICLSMVDSNFIGNMALYDGGAVYKKNNCGGAVSTSIRNCTFAHNVAFGPQVPAITDRSTGGGGAIFSTSDLQICSSVFANNSANFGGALRTGKADVFIESSAFVNNMALDVGSLSTLSLFHLPAKLTIIDDGSAQVAAGGALYLDGVNTELSGARAVVIQHSLFHNNIVYSSPSIAIAIWVSLYQYPKESFILTNVTLQKHVSTSLGGSVLNLNCFGPVTVKFDGLDSVNNGIVCGFPCLMNWGSRTITPPLPQATFDPLYVSPTCLNWKNASVTNVDFLIPGWHSSSTFGSPSIDLTRFYSYASLGSCVWSQDPTSPGLPTTYTNLIRTSTIGPPLTPYTSSTVLSHKPSTPAGIHS